MAFLYFPGCRPDAWHWQRAADDGGAKHPAKRTTLVMVGQLGLSVEDADAGG